MVFFFIYGETKRKLCPPPTLQSFGRPWSRRTVKQIESCHSEEILFLERNIWINFWESERLKDSQSGTKSRSYTRLSGLQFRTRLIIQTYKHYIWLYRVIYKSGYRGKLLDGPGFSWAFSGGTPLNFIPTLSSSGGRKKSPRWALRGGKYFFLSNHPKSILSLTLQKNQGCPRICPPPVFYFLMIHICILLSNVLYSYKDVVQKMVMIL